MRLSPLPADQWDDAVDTALAGMLPKRRRNPQGAGNALATMVRNPELTRTFLPFNAHLLFGSTLAVRLRELAILRVAALRNCPYEVEHHTGMALAAGVTVEEIADAQNGVAHDDLDRAILDAATELDRESTISDSTW
ncbi:carboxymuconolactone decarboxylase family protein, partial [Streptomyces sp. SID10244]|nr:carboxymuconolactone decarboxylase family protein [Streptomyces sp. SID10244]